MNFLEKLTRFDIDPVYNGEFTGLEERQEADGMFVKFNDIQNVFETLSTYELDILIERLKTIQRTKYEEQYIEIRIYPGESIPHKIEDETGYECYHISSSTGGRGTHVIVIPRSEYTQELEQELIQKYDDLSLRS